MRLMLESPNAWKVPMRKFICLLCTAIVLTVSTDLRPQDGMRVTVETVDGEEIALYKDSYALVIGNGAYQVKNGWNPLPGAVEDVKEVAEVLERHGFKVTLKIDVTQAEFNEVFSAFIYESGKDKDNRLLFYYAGHGYTTQVATGDTHAALVMLDTPSPANAAAFDLYSVDMVKFVSDTKKIHAKHVLFMFDSCFSDAVLPLNNRVTPSHITDRIQNPVRQFITAGRADDPVPDTSVFKKAFLDLLEGRVEEPTPDGYLTGVELGDYLYRTVPQYANGQHPQHGKIHEQQVNTGDFLFLLPKKDEDSGIELNTMAALNITSTPEGANIYVDGVLIGETPMRNYQIDTGVHLEKTLSVGLELSGYKSRVKNIVLKGGQEFPWDVSFEKISPPPVPPKPEPTARPFELTNDISTDADAAYYLSLVSHHPETLLPVNDMNEWAGWSETAVVLYNAETGVWEKTKDGQRPYKPDGFVENEYIKLFDHWMYSHAESRIVYDISDGAYTQFGGYFLMPNPCDGVASVELIFLADAVEVYNSGVIVASQQNSQPYVSFNIPAGTETLTMRVTDGGDGNSCDHWILGNARLLAPLPEIIIENDIRNKASGARSPNLRETIVGNDGAEMVLIPAGEFQMGSAPGTSQNSATTPAHSVYVDAFYIDKYEVTVGQYKQFVLDTGHPRIRDSLYEYAPTDQHPVVGISWNDAMAYAKWAGKRLPTEAEWEKAARGGLVGKEHPWGNTPPDGTQCNFADKSLSRMWHIDWGDNHAHKSIDDGYAYTAPVGSFPPNGYGVHDMAGNVTEWCFDAYDENFYAHSPRRNPIADILIRDGENQIVAMNKKHVVRGGSWYYSLSGIWIASRNAALPTSSYFNYGFRCAKSVAP